MGATFFKIERVKRELTQLQLAAISGIPQYRISLLERGVKPKPEEVEKLANALNIQQEEFSQPETMV